VRLLDEQAGERKSGSYPARHGTKALGILGAFSGTETGTEGLHDGTGGASRFFLTTALDAADFVPWRYQAKASRAERHAGCEGLAPGVIARSNGAQAALARGEEGGESLPHGFDNFVQTRNHHPTVKSLSLMRWMARLITPPGGTLLDMFAGSGTTGVAAIHEGLSAILVEQDAGYCDIIRARLAHAERMTRQLPLEEERVAD